MAEEPKTGPDHDPAQQQGAPGRPSTTRQIGVRREATGGLTPDQFDEIYDRVRGYLAQLARLYSARNLSQLLNFACDAVEELFRVAHYRLCRYDPAAGRYDIIVERDTGRTASFDRSGAGDLTDLIEWASKTGHVVFFDLSEGQTDRISGAIPSTDTATLDLDGTTVKLVKHAEANVVGVIPVSGARGPIAAIIMWIADPDLTSRVLETELLKALAIELGTRADLLSANEKMRNLSTLFDNILESVPQGILAIDRQDKVIALNSNAEFLFDLKRIFVLDENFREVLPEPVVQEFRLMMDRLLLGPAAETELEVELAHGATVHLGISASYLHDRQGRPQGYLFLCRDLSLSREVEKLRELDQLKTEFVNTVSHELKTPLTAILGGLEIIQSDPASVAEDFRDLVGVVNDSAHRLRDLIFDLLNLSRLESGKSQLELGPCDVKALVEGVVRLLPAHPRHTVTVSIPQDLPVLQLDREKITQAVTNFVTNAIKYSPRGGEVGVCVELEGGSLKVSVSDQGIGISRENLEKIWEKFYRVDASVTAEIEGTGLGLVIVQRIVQLHGGQVFVESEFGKGSTFGFRIPLDAE